MPITLTAPRDVFTETGQQEVMPQLIAALIDMSGGAGNEFFTSIIGGTLHILEPENIYAGDGNRPLIMVELKLPNIGLATIEQRAAFVAEATNIVNGHTVPGHNRDDIWVNILNAPDGGWGIGGHAYTGDALIAAVVQSAEHGRSRTTSPSQETIQR